MILTIIINLYFISKKLTNLKNDVILLLKLVNTAFLRAFFRIQKQGDIMKNAIIFHTNIISSSLNTEKSPEFPIMGDSGLFIHPYP